MKKIFVFIFVLAMLVNISSVAAFAASEQPAQTYSFSEFNPRSVSDLSDYSVSYDAATGEKIVKRLDKTDLPLVASESDSAAFEGIQPYGAIGYWALVSDSKVRPYSRICQIDMTTSSGKFTAGSGCMIRPGIILTAAHNLSPVTGSAPVKAIARFGLKGSGSQLIATTTTAASWTVNAEWAYNKNVNYDYAVIDVPTSVSTPTGYFGWSISMDSSTQYTLSGYPFDDVNYKGYYMYTESGIINSTIYDDDTSFNHPFNACAGVSGAPVYDNATGRVVGIHTWGNAQVKGGVATKITSDVIALINSRL